MGSCWSGRREGERLYASLAQSDVDREDVVLRPPVDDYSRSSSAESFDVVEPPAHKHSLQSYHFKKSFLSGWRE